MLPYLIIGLIFIISLILISISTVSNHFKEYTIRLTEAETSIDAALRKRFDLLNKASEIIKELEIEDDLPTISSIRSQKLDNFELDKELYKAIDEFQECANKNSKVAQNEGYIKVQINLVESESEIVALRKYYNDMSNEYNKLVSSFPRNIVAFLRKYKTKQLFEEREEKKSLLEDLKA